jgi:predicted phage-related endonuclease
MTDLPSSRPWIGGSSIAAILSLPNPGNRTPLTEYLRLTEPDSELDVADEQFFEGRRALEQYMAHKLRTRGIVCTTFNQRYSDPEFPWLRAEIDAESEGANQEFKTSTEWLSREFGAEGSDDFPMYQAAQVQWGLGIHHQPVAYLNVCLGFDRFQRYPVEPDPELFQQMRRRAIDFMQNHVIPRVPPPPINLEDAKHLWPTSMARSILADEAMMDKLARHAELRQHGKDLEAEADQVKLAVQQMLQDADQALGANGKPVVTWRSNKDSQVLDKDELIQRLQAKLLEHGNYVDWISETRKALVTTKPGARVFLNKVGK